MNGSLPSYLRVPTNELGLGTAFRVHIGGDMTDIAERIARLLLDEIEAAGAARRAVTFIVPVGPVDHYPILARRINERRCSLQHVTFINMDEYLTDADEWLPLDHPLSLRGYMLRLFYEQLDPKLAPPEENRIFPDPRDPSAIARLIAERDGVDVCIGGIGINGHVAFNEPPEPNETCTAEQFARLPTRVLSASRETRTINSVTVGGEIGIIPRRAVTVGMKEILASRKIRLYCNRPWQRAVVRRVVHGPLTPACPASLLRLHPDVSITVADYVAALPDIRLR